MSYTTRWAVAQSGTLTNQIAMSLVNAAIAISSEATSTTNHANRVALAKAVLNNPVGYAQVFAAGIVDNLSLDTAALAAAATDAQLDGSVSALWNAYAGVQ
jgi:hypothetical protein